MYWRRMFQDCSSSRHTELTGGQVTGQGGRVVQAARQGRGRTLVRVLLALLVVLGSGELFVRSFVGGPSPQAYDPEIGFSYQPGSDLFQAKEGFTHLHFNALGLNDREPARKGGRCRVLVIGDSYTAALQVPQDQNFTSVAERLDPHLDVVNGGRDGLFLGDMHKVAARLLPQLRPDLVVYVISERAVETDIALPGFSVIVDPRSGAIVDAVMQVEGQESLKRIFGPVLSRSALATRLSAQFKPMVVDLIGQIDSWRHGLSSFGEAQAAQAAPGRASVPAPSDVEVLTFIFRRFRAQAPAALLYINGLSYAPHRKAAVAATSSAAEVVAVRAATRAGVSFHDTGEYLVESLARTGQPPFGFNNALLPGGHLNAAGHAAVGHALLDLVDELGPQLASDCRI